MSNEVDIKPELSDEAKQQFYKEIAHQYLDPIFKEHLIELERDTAAQKILRLVTALVGDAAMFSRSSDFYKDIVRKCGESIGEQAYICDDGSKSDCVLALKVPELVAELVNKA
jgi:hypothetical protein